MSPYHTPDEVCTVPNRNSSFYLTMPDGVELYTVIYYPDDGGSYGTVLERTPYGTGGAGTAANRWLPLGFAVVVQDHRGSGRSGDVPWTFWRNDKDDSYSTQEWISSQSWSNGNIFTVGVSASALSVYAGALGQPEWTKAAWPQWGSADGYDSVYQGGAYREALISRWLNALRFGYVIDEIHENEPLNEWWENIQVDDKAALCGFPAMHEAGWWDIFMYENVEAFNAFQYESSDPACLGKQKMVISAGGHCGSGDYRWPDPTTDLGLSLAQEMFLTADNRPVPEEILERNALADTITFYVQGGDPDSTTEGNYWTTLPVWPEVTPLNLYLHSEGELALTAPTTANSSSSFTYDSSNPVPTRGGPELLIPCGPMDQTPVESRDDMLIFTGDVLTEAMALTGDLSARLYVSSDALDTDFVVKISDVYPDGRSIMIMDGVVRMRWRESKSEPTWMEEGVVYPIDVQLWKTSYIMDAGHQVRVAVTSSNNPRWTPNRNNGNLIEEEGDFESAGNTVFHSEEYPSYITLPTVRLQELPDNFEPRV